MLAKILKRPELAGFLALMACGVAIWLGAFLFYKEPAAAPPAPQKVAQPAGKKAVPEPVAGGHELSGSGVLSRPNNLAQPAGEDSISAIISNNNLDFPAAVDQLLNLLPNLEVSSQEEAAHHIANLSDDDQAKKWAAKVVADQIPAAAAEVLYNDMLNRPHELLLPSLATMADNAKHPRQKESAETLEILYGEPPQGTKWSDYIKARMAEEANK